MVKDSRCPRCGETGPSTLFVSGDSRIGVCPNQHRMTIETFAAQPFAHRRLSNWLRNLERGGRSPYSTGR